MIENSLTQQLENSQRQHANAVALANAYLEALTSQKDEIDVALNNADGTVSNVKVKSNSKMWSELERLRASLQNISGLTNSRTNAIVSLDDKSSFREIFVQNYARSYSKAKADEIVFDTGIKTDTNSIIESLLSPLTTVEAELAERFLDANEVKITKFIITDGDFSAFANGETYSSVLQKLATGAYQYKRVDYLLDTVKRDTRYYGEFDVISQVLNNDSTITVQSNTLKYSDKLNAVENSRELVVGNKLVSTDGSTQFVVTAIDVNNNKFTIKAEAGFSPLTTGTSSLSILSVEDSEKRKVRIPVKLKEQSIIFLSPVNKSTNAEAPFSEAKLFDASAYTVTINNDTFTFNEYFASRVADIGGYFESIVRESAIPASLGEKPEKPAPVESNFNVVQINRHLTNTPEAEKLKTLQSDYDKTASEVSVLNAAIQTLNSRIARGNYTSTTQKDKDVATLSAKTKSKSEKSAYLASIVTDIKTALANTSARSVEPKYRVRGFWPIQSEIPSTVTSPQKIVQYEVRYRYTSNNKTTTDADQMSYTDKDDNTVNAVFSPWSYYKTEPLKKFKNAVGQFVWESNDVSSAEQSNINQLDIPIQYGENVELQVRALSEAGYPTSPVTSDWSNLIVVKFPTNLLQESSISTIARENAEALRKVELQEEFKSQGITEHVSTAIREKDIYYAHTAMQIASGFRTNEQTIISLYDILVSQSNEIKSLKEIVDRRYAKISPQILDTNDRIHEISKFSKIKLFAGYYTDSVNLTDEANYGTIVTKVFYLRLNNKNSQTVELLSISPGTLTSPTNNALYSDVPVSILGNNGQPLRQLNGQIFYNRNIDISGSQEFYVDNTEISDNTVPASDIDATAIASTKNVVHLTGSSFDIIKLAPNASLDGYVAISKSHPLYVQWLADNSLTAPIFDEFERIKQYNSTYREQIVQNKYNADRAVEYIKDDKYLVGKNSIGSRLFVQFNQISAVQVDGIDNSSALQIAPSETNAIIVPLVFQYRMTDAAGFVNGDSSLTTNSNFEYIKTIGIDMLVGGETFKFDIEVSAKFRPTSISNNNLGIQTTQNIDATSSINPNV